MGNKIQVYFFFAIRTIYNRIDKNRNGFGKYNITHFVHFIKAFSFFSTDLHKKFEVPTTLAALWVTSTLSLNRFHSELSCICSLSHYIVVCYTLLPLLNHRAPITFCSRKTYRKQFIPSRSCSIRNARTSGRLT